MSDQEEVESQTRGEKISERERRANPLKEEAGDERFPEQARKPVGRQALVMDVSGIPADPQAKCEVEQREERSRLDHYPPASEDSLQLLGDSRQMRRSH